MKKLIKCLIVTAIIMLIPVYAGAVPGVVLPLDAYTGEVTGLEFVVTFDGVEELVPYQEVQATDGNTYILIKRLDNISEGDHTMIIVARNIFDKEAEPLPFTFSVGTPTLNTQSVLLKDVE